MTKKLPWHINESDISFGTSGSTSSGRTTSKWTKQPSSMDARSRTLTMKHIPTGVEVTSEIPLGNYSNKELHKAIEKLKVQLRAELEIKVAKHLRIPGMSY